MLTPEQARDLTARLVETATAKGASDADCAFVGSRALDVEIRDGALEDVSRSEAEKVGLRVFIGQRSASVSGSNFSADALDELAARALDMARQAPEDDYAGLAPEEMLLEGSGPDLDLDDPTTPGPEELRDRALEIEAAMLAVDGVTKSGGTGASHSSGLFAFSTSHGFSGSNSGSGHGHQAGAIASGDDGMERDHHWHSTRHLEDLESPESIGREAGRRAAARIGEGVIETGSLPILFDPRVATTLLGHLSAALNGASVARRSSFLAEKMGERIFRADIDIIDDPLLPRGLRSHAFDGEGLEARRQSIIKGGVLKSWFADSASARQLGIEPTRHAVRGPGGGPGAGPSNFFMKAGKRSPADLMRSAPKMLLVTELIGQGVNGVTGDYSRGAAGFIVEGGEITKPVSGITIASNLIEMFANLEAGSDLEMRRGIECPSLLVPDMTVAAG